MVERGRGGGEGVRTRDHLANVRTTLTWIRVAVLLMSAGYGLDKLAALDALHGVRGFATEYGRSLGLLALAAAVVTAVATLVRFLRARGRIESARYEARPAADVALVGWVAAGTLAVLVMLVITR
jgi:uncharacterized membrane protein YidH (DUF202 family)